MSRRYYNPATGIDLLPDVPTERTRGDGAGAVRGILYASAISGAFIGLIVIVWAALP